jgi:hypothetical protein
MLRKSMRKRTRPIIDPRTLDEVVSRLLPRPSFATRDVSDDPKMIAAHPGVSKARNFKSFVGLAISRRRTTLGLKELRKRTPRGSVWARV